MSALLRAPILHFIVLGALLFLARTATAPDASRPGKATETRIALSADDLDALSSDFARASGRAPTEAELERLVEGAIEEELLFREALARGLLERDGGVETRLIQKMLFLESDARLEEAGRLLERALALDLHLEDVVVRRILVQKMRLLGGRLREDQHPSHEEVEGYYEANRERLRMPDRRTLHHVFLSRDRRGDRLEEDAAELFSRVAGDALAPERAIRLGDPFPLGHHLEQRSRSDLSRRFGDRFADRAFAAPSGSWTGPTPSAYGAHLLFVAGLHPGEVPAFETVEERLRLELAAKRRAANLETLISELRARYAIDLPPRGAPPRAGEDRREGERRG